MTSDLYYLIAVALLYTGVAKYVCVVLYSNLLMNILCVSYICMYSKINLQLMPSSLKRNGNALFNDTVTHFTNCHMA